jgi:hypothetical protein
MGGDTVDFEISFKSIEKYEDISSVAPIAQLGERQTEDLKVTCSIHVGGSCGNNKIFLFFGNRQKHGFFLEHASL